MSDPYGIGHCFVLTTLTGMELVVDGEVVDLNRIRLPVDTPIIDKRFANK